MEPKGDKQKQKEPKRGKRSQKEKTGVNMSQMKPKEDVIGSHAALKLLFDFSFLCRTFSLKPAGSFALCLASSSLILLLATTLC